jgi:hypothetical protein
MEMVLKESSGSVDWNLSVEDTSAGRALVNKRVNHWFAQMKRILNWSTLRF